jgi:predicted nicotinamide N-methyase
MEDVVEEVVGVHGRELRLLRPRDSEALLDEHAFEAEEFLPYWADLWPSALALARAVASRVLGGRRVVELGCGLGLPSIVAASCGARVLAVDWSAAAVAMAAGNAERNRVRLDTLVASWAAPEPIVERGPFDLVLASDVLYEERNVLPLLEALDTLVGPAGEVWLTDPRRRHTPAFLELAGEHWRTGTLPSSRVDGVDLHVLARDRARLP